MFAKKVKRETRELVVRSSLLEKLKQVVQSLLQPSVGIGTNRPAPSASLGHADNTNVLCSVLEALFIHGLRDSLGERMSTLFADPDRMPVPNFWPIVLIISHRDLLEQVEELAFITSEVGKSRAWLRLAINQCHISSYFSALSGDTRTLKEYYRTSALLRDQECCDIMLRILQPISSISFSLATNAAVLNAWTQTPLILAGLWAPSSVSVGSQLDPVMAATDVASTVIDDNTQGMAIPDPENTVSDVMFHLIIGGTPETSFIKDIPDASRQENSRIDVNTILNLKLNEDLPPTVEMISSENKDNDNAKLNEDGCLEPETYRRYTGSSFTDNESLTRSISFIQDAPAYRELFSAFESAQSHDQIVPSLLASSTVEYSDEESLLNNSNDQSFSSLDEAINLNFEILPKQFLLGEEPARLLPLLVQLTTEDGLDAQEYQCYDCKAYIGMLYGKPRVCAYDSKYYCNDCHEGELSLIPARLVHNWDLTHHAVSCNNRKWLASVYHQPLIDLRSANPRLYCHVDDLAEIQLLRRQLLYLRAYFLTCKSGAEQELRKKLWPREYLYEHVHLYSVFDLQLISTGQLVASIRRAVVWGRQHVLGCALCSARGFICELCNKNEIIYPFQIGNTHTCNKCFAVYHYNCTRTKSCPRCQRIKLRKDADNSEQNI